MTNINKFLKRILVFSVAFLIVTFANSIDVNAVSYQIDIGPNDPPRYYALDAQFESMSRITEPVWGRYSLPADSNGELDMYINFPNNGGKSWMQGDIKIYNNGRLLKTVGIANMSSEFAKITWKELTPNSRYYFSYTMGKIGRETGNVQFKIDVEHLMK